MTKHVCSNQARDSFLDYSVTFVIQNMGVQIKGETVFSIYLVTFVIQDKCVQNKQEVAFEKRKM